MVWRQAGQSGLLVVGPVVKRKLLTVNWSSSEQEVPILEIQYYVP
jgi:hypothetical protein